MMCGPKNLITDVFGVTVGHQTICAGDTQTGVTAILPHQGNLFRQKVVASCYIANGFGKSTGLMQVEELGTIETPILLTNTFAVGTAFDTLVQYSLAKNPEIGVSTGTVNPMVFECNDGQINAIEEVSILPKDAAQALKNAKTGFAQGSIGAGTGMVCYDLKGGIGSASRVIQIDGKSYTIGALVLSNYGQLKDLTIQGYPIGEELNHYCQEQDILASKREKEKGSIIVILATDIPLSNRQLKRVCKRGSVGITRTGAFIGNGSGEVILGFSTSQIVSHFSESATHTYQIFNENHLDSVFRATADVVNEAILHSLVASDSTVDRHNRPVRNLIESIELLQQEKYDAKRELLLKNLQKIKDTLKN